MTHDNKAILETIKEQEVDALYEKKKHFNAADRKQKYNLQLGLPVVIINTIVGSIIFLALGNIFPNWVTWIAAFLALFSAILAGIQTFFNFPIQITGHRDTAAKYLALGKEYKRLRAGYNDNLHELKAVYDKLEQFSKKHEQINKDGSAFSTNYADYQKAHDSFQEEESYTEAEKSG
ncbi:MAG TPA: SLATT domain-containing protein [Thiotrichaceae bacterium]|nr:SLATT domain-containing protein [Thiotrichaceae bacterium]